jgi:hypothetical protein
VAYNKLNNMMLSNRFFLTCGVLAGPLYLFTSLVEMVIREGFNPLRHSWSLLSNGDLGWIHVLNLIITGLLTIAGAIGIHKVLKGKGITWASYLLCLYGISLVAAGIFVADPVNGFPPDAPTVTTMSTSGLLHLISGSIGFFAFSAACILFARYFAITHEYGWAKFSLVTGIAFFTTFVGIAAGSQPNSPVLVLVTVLFTLAVLLSWAWFTLVSYKFIQENT